MESQRAFDRGGDAADFFLDGRLSEATVAIKSFNNGMIAPRRQMN